jgi:hypothetical protein
LACHQNKYSLAATTLLLFLKICNIKPLLVLLVVVIDDLNVVCSVKLLSFSLLHFFYPGKHIKTISSVSNALEMQL